MSKADRPDQPGAAERFNEDKATYAVRGSDSPDLEAGVAAIRNVLKTLPVRPGAKPGRHDAEVWQPACLALLRRIKVRGRRPTCRR